ncbi:hypothetical protein BRADI_3g20796v3 [Brachypodium distachyon]|uniref:Uncharacterized protein n=1 Tax=Brachypodium distachyon TaxID=15368 RepID=A0A2K2CYI7_BRADI|nr:hypothetical protein BRADI_3g20796v3 [Brachypodium distachyon]
MGMGEVVIVSFHDRTRPKPKESRASERSGEISHVLALIRTWWCGAFFDVSGKKTSICFYMIFLFSILPVFSNTMLLSCRCTNLSQ